VSRGAPPLLGVLNMLTRSLSLEDLQQLSAEIQHLVRAGLPLEQSLVQAGQGHGRTLQRVTESIASQLSQGRSLSDIVEQEKIGAPRILSAAVGAGLQSGDLGLAVEMLGDFAADINRVRRRLLEAATYPLTIVFVAGVLMFVVIQHTMEVLLDVILSWNLPANSVLVQLLIWNRDIPGWTLSIPLAAMLLMGFWFMSGRASAMAFRGPERLLLLIPGIGPLIRDLQTYTLTRMLAMLIERQLPLPEALSLAGGISGSVSLQKACRHMAAAVQEGRSASEVSSEPNLPPLLNACLSQTDREEARLVHRLRSVADFYRSRMERNATWVRMVMPVVLFLVIGGGCVMLYSLMVFWPVSEIYRHLGAG